MAFVVLYQNKWPCEGTWHTLTPDGVEAFKPEHVRKGQELVYRQGRDFSRWVITEIRKDGTFEARSIPCEDDEEAVVRTFQVVAAKAGTGKPDKVRGSQSISVSS